MPIYEIIVIGKALTSWVNTVMIILVIIGVMWLLERVLYKTCVDLLELWRQFKIVKRMRDWTIIEDGEE